jgi:hypothetical protein
MELTLSFDSTADMVLAKPIGEVTTENVLDASKKTFEFAQRHDCRRVLFDITACAEAQSLLEGFQVMGAFGSATGFSVHHRLAVFYDPAIYPNTRAKFIEDVVYNRPNPQLRMFDSREAALGWLLETGSSAGSSSG